MNEYFLEATGYDTDDLIRKSHYPDLSERLIETHRILQMSREYLMEKTELTDRQGIRNIDHLFDAMNHVEQAIKGLTQ